MAKDSLLALRFGMIAVRNNFASRSDIDRAVALIKQREGQNQPSPPIGEIFVKAGIISAEQRDEILQIQQNAHAANAAKNTQPAPEASPHRTEVNERSLDPQKEQMWSHRFGMIAIRKGYATREDMDRALASQQKAIAQGRPTKRIGAMMVELGIITEDQRQEILSIQDAKTTRSPKTQPEPSAPPFSIIVADDSMKAFIQPATDQQNVQKSSTKCTGKRQCRCGLYSGTDCHGSFQLWYGHSFGLAGA